MNIKETTLRQIHDELLRSCHRVRTHTDDVEVLPRTNKQTCSREIFVCDWQPPPRNKTTGCDQLTFAQIILLIVFYERGRFPVGVRAFCEQNEKERE